MMLPVLNKRCVCNTDAGIAALLRNTAFWCQFLLFWVLKLLYDTLNCIGVSGFLSSTQVSLYQVYAEEHFVRNADVRGCGCLDLGFWIGLGSVLVLGLGLSCGVMWNPRRPGLRLWLVSCYLYHLAEVHVLPILPTCRDADVQTLGLYSNNYVAFVTLSMSMALSHCSECMSVTQSAVSCTECSMGSARAIWTTTLVTSTAVILVSVSDHHHRWTSHCHGYAQSLASTVLCMPARLRWTLCLRTYVLLLILDCSEDNLKHTF